jgi:prevent-host-death family protein
MKSMLDGTISRSVCRDVATLLFCVLERSLAAQQRHAEADMSQAITTMSSRQFNQDAGGAKKAAEHGPVIITDRGQPSHVLLSYAEYQRLLSRGPSILEALSMPGGEDIEFDPPKLQGPFMKPVDFDLD